MPVDKSLLSVQNFDHDITGRERQSNANEGAARAGEKGLVDTASDSDAQGLSPASLEKSHEVNTHYAAQLQPSKLRGKALTAMVTFVAGTGFTLFGYDQGV